MFCKLIYQKKAALTEADARDFSTKDYTCVKLLLTTTVSARSPQRSSAVIAAISTAARYGTARINIVG